MITATRKEASGWRGDFNANGNLTFSAFPPFDAIRPDRGLGPRSVACTSERGCTNSADASPDARVNGCQVGEQSEKRGYE